MDPFDNDKRRKKKNPFDHFGDDDFFKDIFNDDRIMDDIRRMAEEMMKMFSNAQPGKSFVHGYKINFGPDGKPRIEDFGNRPLKTKTGDSMISEERKPLTDIIEGKDDVAITVEIPGVEKDDIDLNVKEESLQIKVNAPHRKYHKVVDLPCKVKPKSTKATYKNGILDVVLEKKEKRTTDTGYKVNIK